MSVVTDAMDLLAALQVLEMQFSFRFKWIVMLAPLGIVFYMSFGINKMSASKAQTTFWVFAALMGLSLSSIFISLYWCSITRVFLYYSDTFGAMSLWIHN